MRSWRELIKLTDTLRRTIRRRPVLHDYRYVYSHNLHRVPDKPLHSDRRKPIRTRPLVTPGRQSRFPHPNMEPLHIQILRRRALGCQSFSETCMLNSACRCCIVRYPIQNPLPIHYHRQYAWVLFSYPLPPYLHLLASRTSRKDILDRCRYFCSREKSACHNSDRIVLLDTSFPT